MYLYEQIINDALKDMTTRDLGKLTGIPAASINDWIILKKKPHLKNLTKLSKWAELPLSAMLTNVIPGHDELIIRNLSKLTEAQKQRIADMITTMLPPS